VTNPERRAYCAAVRATMAANDGDEHGDYTPFSAERDYVPDADKLTASVFVVHGTNDENVRPDDFSKWWYELKDTPRKLWLTQTGHVDPFDFRRGVWVDTHRWFDSELWKVKNGIWNEPEATIERSAGVFADYSQWPDADMEKVRLRLADTGPTTAGLLETGPKPRDGHPEPARVPDAAAPAGRPDLGDAVRVPVRFGRPDRHELRRPPRRLGARHARAMGGRRRHPDADDRGLLG
jgi:X-Pro dipeptidyl-peptidase